MLKNLTKIILTTFIVVSFVYVFNFVYKNKDQFNLQTLDLVGHKIENLVNKRNCNQVITYSLGSVNKNFGLTNDQFLKAVKEAETLWEKGAGRNLFDYSSSGELKINLVFDQRQEDTFRMQEILGGITSDEDKLAAVKKEYDQLSATVSAQEESLNSSVAQYQKDQAQFEELAMAYNSKIADYERQVAFWNARGGAPKREYNDLSQQKAEIDNLYIQLNAQQQDLKNSLANLNTQKEQFNSLVSQVNTIAGIYNRLADKLNVKVVAYNEVQGARDEFVSGLYTINAQGEKIDIFQFYDNKDLVTTLAHELGHALGLGHASGASSIMYPKSEGQKTQLTKEDLQMLAALCN